MRRGTGLSTTTNGKVAVKAFKSLNEKTGLKNLEHLAKDRESERFTFDEIAAQPKETITSPTFTGSNQGRRYTPFTTNIEELVPFRTVTGRQSFYLDHEMICEYGEAMATFKPILDYRPIKNLLGGAKEITLKYLTPHNKWSIHSMYFDSQQMLTLFRGGQTVWMSEKDAEAWFNGQQGPNNLCVAYAYGQCTWWTCMRAKKLGWKNVGQYWGNGQDWARSGAAAGYKTTTDAPVPGSIISWPAGVQDSDPTYARIARGGHIELVSGDDGVDTVAQCCGHGAHGLLTLLIARRGKRGRRCLGGNGKIVDIRGYIDRHGRPFLLEVCNHGSRFAHGLARGGRIGQPETPQRTEDSHGPHHFVPRPRPLRRGPQHRRPP